MRRIILVINVGLIVVTFFSCKKFLDAKPTSTVTVPESLTDLQLLLDNYEVMNNSFPNAIGILEDNYYVLSSDWATLSNVNQRNLYIWEKDDETNTWWNGPYDAIYNCNIILDHLNKISYSQSEQDTWNRIKGAALFIRAYYYYGLAQIFAQPYFKSSASQDLGLPLRLNSDFNESSFRSSVFNTYEQIISDLKASITLLPETPTLKTHPSRPAAYGALAKVYLAMQEYDSAGVYADRCLALYNGSLIDYNSISTTASTPFSQFNSEVIFHMRSPNATILGNARAKVDSQLYKLYQANDLRKVIFFKTNTGTGSGTYQFKGDYDGRGTSTGFVFAGVVLDEMYLIRAENKARKGDIQAAIDDLNLLLKKRWKDGLFVPFTAGDSNAALDLILTERRKELFFRGTRWTDLRRLMNESQFSVIPKRIINNLTYQLVSNSSGYTLQIPFNVIQFTGMLQNP